MKGSLKLQNDHIFEGIFLNRSQKCSGDIVYYTGMSNFQSFLSDPALKGKIVVCTYTNILHTKLNKDGFESEDIQAKALITQQKIASTDIQKGSLADYCIASNIPVLMDVDTRSVMKQLRLNGEMTAQVSSSLQVEKIFVAEKNSSEYSSDMILNPDGETHIVLVNFGVKKSLLTWLLQANAKITIVSPHQSLDTIETIKPNGLVFSGGPGHPEDYQDNFQVYKQLCETYPTIGFGLGHQIIAMMYGAHVTKLKHGHRSFKHPIIHVESNKVYLTNQNHSFDIELDHSDWQTTFKSVQDGSMEGMSHKYLPIQSYQFHINGQNIQFENELLASFQLQMKENEGVYIYA